MLTNIDVAKNIFNFLSFFIFYWFLTYLDSRSFLISNPNRFFYFLPAGEFLAIDPAGEM